jgi:hypothetical protein
VKRSTDALRSVATGRPWLCAALAIGLGAAPAFAASSSWTASCRQDGRPFSIEMTQASDQSTSVRLMLPDIDLPLIFEPGLVRARGVVANRPSLCSGLGAFPIQDRIHQAAPPSLLLLLSIDDPPGFDILSLFLIDLQTGRELDRIERLAPIKDVDGRQRLTLQVDDDRLAVRLQRLWLHNTHSDSPENSIEDWYEIEIRAGRIRGTWQR